MTIAQPHTGLPSGFKRFDLLRLLRPLIKRLGLRAEDLCYLDYTIGRTISEDFKAGRICMMWVSVEKICSDLSLHPRTLNRIEQRLERAGIIRRCLSAHKHRFGERNKIKEIVFGCGIDLGPLIDGVDRLKAMLTEVQQNFKRLCELKNRCSSALKRLRALSSSEVMNKAKEVFPRLRPSEISDAVKLETICAAFEAARQTSRDAASDNPVRPNTESEIISLTCSREKSRKSQRVTEIKASPAQLRQMTSCRVKAAIDFYSEAIGDPKASPSWQATIMAVRDTAMSIGIKHWDWDTAVRALGAEMVCLSFAIADRNHEREGSRWHVHNVAGAFLNLIQSEVNNDHYLERLWAALRHEGHKT